MVRGKKVFKRLIATVIMFSTLLTFAPTTYIMAKADDSRLTFEEEQGAIFHAWNWSFEKIEENLQSIADAGYTAIQVSPIQGNKDSSIKDTKRWWILYQPTNFKIGNEQLGNKEEFKEMCEAAEDKGIKVYVDVIANHTGNENDNANQYSSNIDDEIKKLGDDAWHSPLKVVEDWDDRLEVTHGCIGLPDLNTENKEIQRMFKDYLKECLESGADGFRVDTAKHIGLPTDEGSAQSDFWPSTFEGLVREDGKKPYVYGEVLQGGADNFYEYSKYINLTSSNYGQNVREAVGFNSDEDISKIEDYESDGVEANKLISWVESHDTYANDSEESTAMTDEQIKNGWALIAAREDANPLFFNRPAGKGKLDGEIGDAGDDLWRDTDVVAVNKFRKKMLDKSENLVEIGDSKKIMMIERGEGKGSGVVIVNMGDDKQITNQDVNLVDGQYINYAAANAEFTVTDGKMSGIIPKGITVLYEGGNKESIVITPKVSIEPDNKSFSSDTLTLTLTAENTAKATYSINGGEKKEYTDETKITIGDFAKVGETITVNLEAVNDTNNRTAKETYKYIKKDKDSCATVYFKRDSKFKTAYIYAYNELGEENAKWPGEKMTYIGDSTYKYELKDFTDCSAIFNDWFYGGNQTSALDLGASDKKIYKVEDSSWNYVNGIINEEADAVDDGIKDGTTKVYFRKPSEWSAYDDICVYFYGKGGPSWPGVSMTKVDGEENLYTYTLAEGLEGSMVLFNAKNGSVQVPKDTGFKAPADSTYIYENGEWKEYLDGCSKVYFRKPADWVEPSIYIYGGATGELKKWPGTAMEKVSGIETLYSYTLPKNYGDAKIIVNDGSNQTIDLDLDAESTMIYENGEFRVFKISDLEEPEVESDNESVTKVYFQNTSDWEKVCVYAYKPGTSDKVKDWPGVTAKSEGNNLYSYSLPEGFEGAIVVFNNGGNGQQTKDLETKVGHSMIYDEATESLKSMSKVYFKNIYEWEKVRIHYWQDGGSGTNWPGESLIYYGNGLYGFEMPYGYETANVIFNNNNKGSQSDTVKINDGDTMILDSNNVWREFKESDVSNLEEDDNSDDNEELTKAYFYNSEDWNDIKIYVYTEKEDGSLDKQLAEWPGVDLGSEGEKLYSYILPKGFRDSVLIFNGFVYEKEKVEVNVNETSGSAVEIVEKEVKKNKQTDNLRIKSGQIMIYKNGEWIPYKEEKDDEEIKIKKVYISGKTEVNQKLFANVIFENDKAIELTYIWQRGNTIDGEFEDIADATSDKYTLTSDDKGKYIRVVVKNETTTQEVASEPVGKIIIKSNESNTSSGSSSKKKKKKSTREEEAVIQNETNQNNDSIIKQKEMKPNGWLLTENNQWNYVENGDIIVGWKNITGKWYFMNNEGIMQKSWIKDNNMWYYLDSGGAMKTGWIKDNYGLWYHLGNDGAMNTGWLKDIDGTWYFLNPSGVMQVGWKEINGVWYYFYNSGAMAYSANINGYIVNDNGAWVS
ncbi:MAG: starch-binding protein [Clostridium butyricum]|nr:starch-binding protein [Clostridium butyricum]